MSYKSNSNYTRVESFGTPSAFDPSNINQSQTSSARSETTINACVSLDGAAINTYSDLLLIGTIPTGANIRSITYNGSQLLPVDVQVNLYISEPTPPAVVTFLTSGPVILTPPAAATAAPSNPGNINGSVTIPTNLTVPNGNGNPVYLWLNLVDGTPATSVVNVAVKYVM